MFSTLKEALRAKDQFAYKRLVIHLKLKYRLFFQAQRRGLLRGRREEEGGWEKGGKEEGGSKGKAGSIWGSLWKKLELSK